MQPSDLLVVILLRYLKAANFNWQLCELLFYRFELLLQILKLSLEAKALLLKLCLLNPAAGAFDFKPADLRVSQTVAVFNGL